ncbi:carbohydrate-binding protein [Diaminobutyricibacter sp. McL0608]|uniref:carbohydrate-binding protein n=1 Tax=Leifsonia sp. McL0608 TaxID=3143537 RepID=UPI0031F30B85
MNERLAVTVGGAFGPFHVATNMAVSLDPLDDSTPLELCLPPGAGGDTVLWTASQTFVTGDVVLSGGRRYTAKWWTRDKTQGDPNGPWSLDS